MDHIGKENSIVSLMDWKIIMFDEEGVKIVKVIWSLSIFFLRVKSKLKSWKKYEVEGHNMNINHNWFKTFQNLFYKFFKWILNVIHPLKSSVFEAHLQKTLIQKNKIC